MTAMNRKIAYVLFLASLFNNILYANSINEGFQSKLVLTTDRLNKPEINNSSHPVNATKNFSTENNVETAIDLSSIAHFFTPISADTNKKENKTINYQYVGTHTRVGVGIDTEFDGTAEVRHFFKDTNKKAVSTEGWLGFDLSSNDKGINAGGLKLNNHWVKHNKKEKPIVIRKTFVAYDRNTQGDDKLTVGYGQEVKRRFWEASIGKGLSGKRDISIATNGQTLFEKGYGYSVGGKYGVFRPWSNTRWRGGLDYSWGDAEGIGENNPNQLAVSLNVEKFFRKKPHSISLDISAAANKGGYGGSHNDIRANLTYRYEFYKKKELSQKTADTTWVKRALYNPLKHNKYVETYQTTGAAALNGAPTAVADTGVSNGGSITINVRGNDTDPEGDSLTIINVTSPANGVASIVNGAILFTPTQGASGLTVFSYTISDGNGGTSTASITVQIFTP